MNSSNDSRRGRYPASCCSDGGQEPWERQLEAGIQRVQAALDRNRGMRPPNPIETLIVAAGTEALEQARVAIKRKSERRRWREEQRRRRREERMRRRDDEASVAHGFVFAGAAAVLLALMASNPTALWWMVFIAFGFSMASAGIFTRARRAKERRALEQGEQARVGGAVALPEASSSDRRRDGTATATATVVNPEAEAGIQARIARVDAICDKILAALKAAPKVVREVVQHPEETLKALRGASKEMARREGELRAVLAPEEDERIKGEREQLVNRITSEHDDVVRLRLGSALKALDEQLAQRAELATAASRYEAEQTRILYTLENLHTQILRARSSDSAAASVAGAGLRLSLEQLSNEIDAVADALDAVHRSDLPQSSGAGASPVGAIGEDGEGDASKDGRERIRSS